MKKILLVVGLISLVSFVEARPGPGPGPGRGPRPGQTMHHQRPPSRPSPGQSFHRPPPPPRHHHYSAWGRGGRNFWPGFVGGLVGGALYDGFVGPTVVTTPTTVVVPQPVVAQPVYETRSVWVDGTYVDQIQPDGRVLKVWTPGHYETRKVPVLY